MRAFGLVVVLLVAATLQNATVGAATSVAGGRFRPRRLG